MQQCKNICVLYGTKKRPFGIKFKSNTICRICGIWYGRDTSAGQRRTCICCGTLLPIKPKQSQNRRNQVAYQVARIE